MPQSLEDACYDGYSAVRGRYTMSGLEPLPVAGPSPQTCVVTRLHGGWTVEWLAWAAIRRGAPPEVPGPKPPNDNLVFWRGGQQGTFSQPEPGGVMMYAVWGLYEFIVLNPQDLSLNLPTGRMPWDTSTPGDHFLPSTSLRDDLVNPDSPVDPPPGMHGS